MITRIPIWLKLLLTLQWALGLKPGVTQWGVYVCLQLLNASRLIKVMNDNWKLPYTVVKPLSFPVSIQSRKYQNPKDIIIRDIKSQKRKSNSIQAANHRIPIQHEQKRNKRELKETTNSDEFYFPFQYCAHILRLFSFSLPKGLRCLIYNLRPCLLHCFCIWLERHESDQWKLAVVLLLGKGKWRKIKRKKKKERNNTHGFKSLGKCWELYVHFQGLPLSFPINIELGINAQDWCAHYIELFHFSLYQKIISMVFSCSWYCSLHLWHTGFG